MANSNRVKKSLPIIKTIVLAAWLVGVIGVLTWTVFVVTRGELPASVGVLILLPPALVICGMGIATTLARRRRLKQGLGQSSPAVTCILDDSDQIPVEYLNERPNRRRTNLWVSAMSRDDGLELFKGWLRPARFGLIPWERVTSIDADNLLFGTLLFDCVRIGISDDNCERAIKLAPRRGLFLELGWRPSLVDLLTAEWTARAIGGRSA